MHVSRASVVLLRTAVTQPNSSPVRPESGGPVGSPVLALRESPIQLHSPGKKDNLACHGP